MTIRSKETQWTHFHLFQSPCGTHRLQIHVTAYLDAYFVCLSVQLDYLTPKSPKAPVCFVCVSVRSTETNCIQRADPLDVQVSTSVPVGSSRPCSAIPNFSFMDLQDPLELLSELWWSSQTRSCPGSCSPCCGSVRVTSDLAQKKGRVALVWMWSGVDHQ